MAEKNCDPPQQLVEVHPHRAQDGVEPIALNPAEAAALHSMLSFQMPNPRLDRRSAFHPPPQAPIDPSAMALIHMDFDISRVSMAAVAQVHKDLLGVCASYPLNLLQSSRADTVYVHQLFQPLGWEPSLLRWAQINERPSLLAL